MELICFALSGRVKRGQNEALLLTYCLYIGLYRGFLCSKHTLELFYQFSDAACSSHDREDAGSNPTRDKMSVIGSAWFVRSLDSSSHDREDTCSDTASDKKCEREWTLVRAPLQPAGDKNSVQPPHARYRATFWNVNLN
jgi:hypothetical protein